MCAWRKNVCLQNSEEKRIFLRSCQKRQRFPNDGAVMDTSEKLLLGKGVYNWKPLAELCN